MPGIKVLLKRILHLTYRPVIARLPVELYRPIITHITSRHDLYGLLFVSRNFRAEAEILLYRSLVIGTCKIDIQIRLFQYLARNPRIALLVRSLAISTPSSDYRPPIAQQYWEFLTEGLRALPNLEHLSLLYEYTDWCFQLPCDSSLLSGLSIKLKALTCSDFCKQYRILLWEQTHIQELYITMSAQCPLLLGPNYQNLSILSLPIYAGYVDIDRSLAGTRVKALHLGWWPSIRFLQSPPHTSVLSLKLDLGDNTTVDSLSTRFPSLRYLQINLLDSECLDEVMQLSELKRVHFTRVWGDLRNTASTWIANAFAMRPSLEAVIIGSPPYARCWTPGDADGKFVECDEEEWKDGRWIEPIFCPWGVTVHEGRLIF